jgi:hypothetical protein
MILEIQDPGWDYTSFYVAGGVVLGVLAVGLVLHFRFRDIETESEMFTMWTAITLVCLIIFGLGGVAAGSSVYSSRVVETKVSGLEELGFDQVSLSGDYFTASRDGAYFSGVLLEGEEPDTWEVAEVLPPVPVEENEK